MAGKSPVAASEEQKAQLEALAASRDRGEADARKHWLKVEWLPKYAPELNDIEVVWHDLKAHHLAHKTFTDVAAFDRSIHAAVDDLNRERSVEPLVNMRISA